MRLSAYTSLRTARVPVAVLGTYPPRACGIATFTRHLATALEAGGDVRPCVVAVTEIRSAAWRELDGLVVFEIEQDRESDYAEAARVLSRAGIAAVNIQHEYGIFGGRWGRMLLTFLGDLDVPVVTTLHTVLPSPDREVQRLTRAIADRSAVLIVMAASAVRILRDDYGVAPGKVLVIPHGIPDGPYLDAPEAKRMTGLKGRTVLTTFGLIGPGKGLEYAIRALPRILAHDPSTLYLIVGQTHPAVIRQEGERYRTRLQALAEDMGVAHAVRFDNRYRAEPEILTTLAATDVYLTPYVNPAQITSGTLTYAVGSGCPVVSTPFTYAQELITPDYGLLVLFRDADAIADAVISLLGDPARRAAITAACCRLRGSLRWSSVARSYARLFEAVTRPLVTPAAASRRMLGPVASAG